MKDSGDAEKLSIAIDNVGIGVRQYDRKVIFGTFKQVDSLLKRFWASDIDDRQYFSSRATLAAAYLPGRKSSISGFSPNKPYINVIALCMDNNDGVVVVAISFWLASR